MNLIKITTEEFLNKRIGKIDNEYNINNKINCFYCHDSKEWNITVIRDRTAIFPEISRSYFRKTKNSIITLLNNSF